MTSGEYERFIKEFGTELGRIDAERTARRRIYVPVVGRQALVLSLLIASAIAIVVSLVPTANHRDDLGVLAEAEAALTPQHQVIYYEVTRRFGKLGTSKGAPVKTQQWFTGNPLRWKIRQVLRKADSAGDQHGPYYGLQEFAYANGFEADFVAQRHTVTISRPKILPKAVDDVFNGDPLDNIRDLLANRALRDVGATKLGDRRVRLLTGERKSSVAINLYAYYVDARSFVPVAGEITTRYGKASLGRSTAVVVNFVVNGYSRMPLTRSTERLLAIAVDGTTSISDGKRNMRWLCRRPLVPVRCR